MNPTVFLILAFCSFGAFGRLSAADVPSFLLSKEAKVETINLSDGRYYRGVEVKAANRNSNWIMISYSKTGTIHPAVRPALARPPATPGVRETAWVNLMQVTSIAGVSGKPETEGGPDSE